MKAICLDCSSVYFNLQWSEPENLHLVAAYAFDYLQATSIPGMETSGQYYVLAIIVPCNRSWQYCMELFQQWVVFWSKILSHTWPCSKRHFLFWQHNMPLSLGIYKAPFQHSFYFSSYTMKWLDHHLSYVSTILQMQHKISKNGTIFFHSLFSIEMMNVVPL